MDEQRPRLTPVRVLARVRIAIYVLVLVALGYLWWRFRVDHDVRPMTITWTPSSWTDRPAKQQPAWPDRQVLSDVTAQLEKRPPLIFAGEARYLTDELARVCRGVTSALGWAELGPRSR